MKGIADIFSGEIRDNRDSFTLIVNTDKKEINQMQKNIEIAILKNNLINYLLSNPVSIPAKTIIATILGMPTENKYPCNGFEFKSCHELLIAIPEIAKFSNQVEKISPEWEILIKNWTKIIAVYNSEAGRTTLVFDKTTSVIREILGSIVKKEESKTLVNLDGKMVILCKHDEHTTNIDFLNPENKPMKFFVIAENENRTNVSLKTDNASLTIGVSNNWLENFSSYFEVYEEDNNLDGKIVVCNVGSKVYPLILMFNPKNKPLIFNVSTKDDGILVTLSRLKKHSSISFGMENIDYENFCTYFTIHEKGE